MSEPVLAISPSELTRGEDVFDELAALDRLGGDSDFLRELVALFLNECPGWLAGIAGGLKERSASQVQLVAHSLKGALFQFSAPAAIAAAQELENVAGRGDLDLVRPAARSLEREVDRLQRRFLCFLEDRRSP